MPSYKQHQEKRPLVEILVNSGLTKKQISEQSGIPFGSVSHYLKMWGLRTSRQRGSGLKSLSKSSKYDHLKESVSALLSQGETQTNVAKLLGIPSGSMPYLVQSWGLQNVGRVSRGSYRSKSGETVAREKISVSHKSRTSHFTRGKKYLKGQYVSEDVYLETIKDCLTRRLTYDQVCSEFGVKSHATIWSFLQKHNLLPGARKGEDDPKWRGGHDKYRGPNWYKNRKLTLERDCYTCQGCGLTNEQSKARYGKGLSVHHKNPYKISQDSSVDNLTTLCQYCHMVEEWNTGRLAT